MADPLVTVMRDRYVHGWPRHPDGARAYVMPLRQALERSYRTDSHFTAYASPCDRRLTREAIDVLPSIELTCVVLDVDCDTAHGTSEPAPQAWRRDMRERVLALSADHPHPYYYETKAGARIVYAMNEPTVLRTQDDGQEWSRTYAIVTAYLARKYCIIADPACGDWQRLYRLPHATRDAGGRPENWPKTCSGEDVGTLTIDATEADVAVARKASKAFRERRVLDFSPGATTGDGLLYYLLRARGDIVRSHGDRAYVIRCPRERDHTTGRTGDGSTLLYRAAPGREIGAIHCMHSHCSGLRAGEWLRLFSESELARARDDAGIVRAA